MTSIKGGCQSCKLFQHSLAPHAFCLTGKIWNASSELVLISPFPALLPLVPNATRDQAGSGRSGFFCPVRRQKDTPSGWLGYFRAPLSDHLCWGSGSWRLVVWGKMQKGPLLSEVGPLSLTWNFTLTTNLFLLLTLSPVTCHLFKCA